MADAKKIGRHSVPVVVSLDRLTSSPAQPCGALGIVQQAADRTTNLIKGIGVDQNTGLPIADRVGNPAGPASNHRYPGCRRFDQRDPEALYSVRHDSRQTKIKLRSVIYRREIAIRDAG